MSLNRLITISSVLIIVIMTSCGVSDRYIKIKSNVIDPKVIKQFSLSGHSTVIDTTNELGDRVLWFDQSFDGEYINSVSKKGRPYTHYYVYNHRTLQLKSTVVIFYRIPIGTRKYYNANGNVDKTEDSEADVTFKAGALISMLKRKYHIDLLSKNLNYSSVDKIKYDKSDRIVYQVLYGYNNRTLARRMFIIDAQTGQVLINKWIQMVE
jgi:hypothetical protein